jgi:large subunit ribosomal protein L19
MQSVIRSIEEKYKKPHVVAVKSGDTVKVHQKIREGNKERVQIFEGLVIRVDRKGSHTSSITVRRIASGVGVEKTYLLHSPLVVKVEVTKRSKVRRNYLTYMRARTGKSARLSSIAFDRQAVNAVPEVEPEAPVVDTSEDTQAATDQDPSDTPAEEPKKSDK